jgi:hypothetical protein
MSDQTLEELRTSTEVMTELVAKAKEGAAVGESRRSFFNRTAKIAGATALGAAGARLFQPVAARAAAATTTPPKNTDTLADILNIAATAECLAITMYYHALNAYSKLPDVNSTANQNYFQAAIIQEYYHLHYLKELGGKPLATEFYFPDGMFDDENVFFPTALTLEGYFIAAYLQASLDFSGAISKGITAANPYALGFAVQVMGIECEHRALLGVAANINPPNGLILERYLITAVQDAVPPLAPFLSASSGYTGPYAVPEKKQVNDIAGTYNFDFFKQYKII